MKTKTLRLNEDLLKKAEKRANDIGCLNLSEYLRHLIINDTKGITNDIHKR